MRFYVAPFGREGRRYRSATPDYPSKRRERWISGSFPPPFTADLTVSLASADLSEAQ